MPPIMILPMYINASPEVTYNYTLGTDAYFKNVTLLSHMDGTNGSTAFTDVKGHTITPVSTVSISTATSKFSGASAYFGGGYLNINTSAIIPSLPITIEMWVRPNSGSVIGLFDTAPGSAGTLRQYGVNQLEHHGGPVVSFGLTASVWQHLAIVMDNNGGNMRITVYVNGTRTTQAAFGSTSYSNTNFVLGGINYGGDGAFGGYMDDVRVTSGAARYNVANATITVPTDPFPDAATDSVTNVTFLSHFNGTDGQTTATDVFGHAITIGGNATISTAQSKFGGSSLYVGGLQWNVMAPTTDLTFPTEDFTVEAWLYTTGGSGAAHPPTVIGAEQPGQGAGWTFGPSHMSLGVTTDFVWTEPSRNEWHHVAVTRLGTKLRAFVDGVKVSETTVSGAVMGTNFQGQQFLLGGRNADGGSTWTGYINDLRITKGFARYAGNFPVPTNAFVDQLYILSSSTASVNEGSTVTITLTAGAAADGTTVPYTISGTGITSADLNGTSLTGNFTVYGSVATLTLTVTADTTTEGAESFTVALDNGLASTTVLINDTSLDVVGDFYWDNVVLLMHMDGTNNSTTFTDVKGHTLTPYNGARISTTSPKFGTGSALFNGSTYITTPDSTDWNLGSSDFTIEFWGKNTHTDGAWYHPVITQSNGGAASNSAFYVGLGNTFGIALSSTAVNSWDVLHQSSVMPINDGNWHHFAAVRSGNTLYLFVDGVQSGTTALAGGYTIKDSSRDIQIGWQTDGGYFTGNIDDLRITKGVARYTSNFAVPTAEFPNVARDTYFNNVTLLMHMDGNNGDTVFTDVKGHTVTRSGNPTISTAQSKFNGASARLGANVNVDYLYLANSTDFEFAGDFTVEFWVMHTGSAGYGECRIIGGGGAGGAWHVASRGTGSGIGWLVEGVEWTLGATGSIADNVWYHFAVSRTGTTMRSFINGVQQASASSGSTFHLNGQPLQIGKGQSGFNGYIDDLRITKGTGRYTGNFTPPALAFPSV